MLALSLVLLGSSLSTAESRERIVDGRGWHGRAARARHARPGRHVYWVLRSPRFYPGPPPPEHFCFAFCPTNRVDTHMY
jgi:hypothetical protein